MPSTSEPDLWVWRHPRPDDARGRCIGRTDLRVASRRTKRLARRIQAAARRHGLPRVVHTSPLRRCADVGRWLRRWGWVHRIDPALIELDFGRWDGRAWDDIPRDEVSAWCEDFAYYAPGGGEPLLAMLERASRWRPADWAGGAVIVVAHAGWMAAREWRADHPQALPLAAQWPVSPVYSRRQARDQQ